MTEKELIKSIVSIVDTTNFTYTEERACSFDDIKILISEYLQSKKEKNGINKNITLKESELIVDALLFYASCQSEFVSYDEHMETQKLVNSIIKKIEDD